MFKHSYQGAGLLAVLHATGSSPLQLWSVEGKTKWREAGSRALLSLQALGASSSSIRLSPPSSSAGKDGAATRTTDPATSLACIDITGPSSTFIACPPDVRSGELGLRLAHLDLLVAQLLPATNAAASPPSSHVTIEVTVRDAGGSLRRLRASTGQAGPRITPALACLPLRLAPGVAGWCRVRLDLASLLGRAYPSNPPFAEVVRLRVYAGVRVRAVWFADKAYSEGALPAEFRLVVPVAKAAKAGLAGVGLDAATTAGAGAAVACL